MDFVNNCNPAPHQATVAKKNCVFHPTNRWRAGPTRNISALLSVIAIGLGLGLGISAYLLQRHFEVLAGTQADTIETCRTVFGADCSQALESSTASQLGLPLAGWGLVYYITLATLLIMGRTIGDSFARVASVAAILLSWTAALVGLILLGMMLTEAAPFCPLCASIHGINLLLVPLLIVSSGRSKAELRATLVAAARYVVGGEIGDATGAKWKVTGLFVAALMAVVVYQWVLIQTDRRSRPRVAARAAATSMTDQFEAMLVKQIPVDDNDPRLGPKEAPLQFVIFSSFQCPGCSRFAQTMADISKEYGEEVSIVFKHYPLSKKCNPALSFDMQPQACAAAHAACAAHRQGAFWAFHDAVFAQQRDLSDETLIKIAQRLELDLEKFRADLTDESIGAKVKADVDLGNQLGVDATPTFYLNGRYVESLRPEAIRLLIRHEQGRRPKPGQENLVAN